MRRRIAAGTAAVAMFTITALLAFWFGGLQGAAGVSVQRVSATAVANAMQDDRFYSDYGRAALVMNAQVISVGTLGTDVVQLQADSSFRVFCDLGTSHSVPHPGDRVTLLTVGAAAERQPSAVLLHSCVMV